MALLPIRNATSIVLKLHNRRVDELLRQVAVAADRESWSRARARFSDLRAELDEHIRIEESLVFPAFDAFTGTIPGATAIMRAEHRELRRWMDILDASLNSEQPLEDAVARLKAALAVHNLKEEHVVYPAFEQQGADEEKQALLQAVEIMGQLSRPA
jgi:iron-sulfur cluster repair protein YtfE (RIC family)